MSSFQKRFNLFKFKTKLLLAGIWFTLTGMRFRTEGLELLIPKKLTDIWLRGQFPINFYERQERKYLKQYLDPESTVLELGGCLGVVSCVTNRLLQNPERHVVIEANPHLISHLTLNRDHNKCKFKIAQCLVSEHPTNTFIVSDNILASGLNKQSGDPIFVSGKSIRMLELEYGLNFDTLVMDIEGAEFDLIEQNAHKLKEINTIFMEVHPNLSLGGADLAGCKLNLERSGFKLVVDETNFWVLKRVI